VTAKLLVWISHVYWFTFLYFHSNIPFDLRISAVYWILCTHTHTHTPIRMFRVKRRRRRLISKSSFSRQCVGRIRDTCSQLTRKSHSPHTHGGTSPVKRRHTQTPAQTSDLHELGHWESKSVKKTATSPFDIHVASSSVIFMIRAANWHETCAHTHTQANKYTGFICVGLWAVVN